MVAYRFDPAAPLRPAAPQVTVFSTFQPLATGDWLSGIEFHAEECVTTYDFPYCGTSHADTTLDTRSAAIRFSPFRVYASATCESVLPTEDPEYVSLVNDKLDTAISWQIARQLWMGSIDPAQTTLQSAGKLAVPIGSMGTSVDWAMGALIQKYTDTAKNGNFTLHAPPRLITYLMDKYLIERDGDRYIGPYGQPVAVLEGYPGLTASVATNPTTWKASAFGPAKDETGAAHNEGGAVGVAPFGQASVDEDWMFISGQVEVAKGPNRVRPDSFRGREMQPRTNRYVVYADTDAIVRFDPCAVFAARVSGLD
jgi:hypothetical protein